jgi:tetratricopeptide (TPR) repeat protein
LTRNLAVARVLDDAGFRRAALSVLRRVARAPNPNANVNLAGLSTERAPFATVRALERAGLRSAALEALQQAIKEHPRAPIPADLQALLERDPFAGVRALAAAGFGEAALEALREQVKSRPTATVPARLRREVANAALREAEALQRAGFDDAAKELLQKALAADPTREPLSAVRAAVAFERVRALERAGFRDTARKQLEEVVETHPNATVPKDLTDLYEPETRAGWWQRALDWSAPGIRTAVEILALLALALGIALLIRALVCAFLRTRVQVADFGGDGGNQLSAAVRADLTKLLSEAREVRLDLVTAWDEELTVPADLTSAFPQAKLLDAVLPTIARFTQAREYVASGSMRPTNGSGPGLTISNATRTGRSVGGTTIWLREFTPEGEDGAPAAKLAAPEGLAAPAAGWILSSLVRETGKASSALGISDWRSYALFANGNLLCDLGDDVGARALYLRSLERDSDNIGAQFNLAVLDIASQDQMEMVRGFSRMATLADRLAADDAQARVLIRLRSEYFLAATLAEVEIGGEVGLRGLLLDVISGGPLRVERIEAVAGQSRALEYAQLFAIRLLLDMAAVFQSTKSPELRMFLRTSRPQMVILLASITTLLGGPWEDAPAGEAAPA